MRDDGVRVCVPVCAKSFAAMEQACARARELGDIVELRLDCLEAEDWATQLESLIRKQSLPFILTLRPSEQGGHRVLSRPQREAFWKGDWDASRTALADIESDLVCDKDAPFVDGPFDWSGVIVSHHDFNGVPRDLGEIYERLARSLAHVVKIAVHANDVTDCLPIFNLLDRAKKENRKLIAIAMGNAGVATRILGPSRGSFLTYGSLEDESATAPGQVTARQLRSVYHVDDINNETMICGLIGRPVMHSVSPHMHNAAFMTEGVNGVYLPIEVRDVEAFINRMVHPRTRELDWNLRGLSVTAPHKASVIELVDWVDPDAKQIGAVNTIVVEGQELRGYNTDVQGLMEPLRQRLGRLSGLSAAVIGAGGAARAAVWALKRDGVKVQLFARTRSKVEALAQEFQVDFEPVQSAQLGKHDIVINATPLGSVDSPVRTPAVAEQLGGAKLVYDLVYNPIETELLKQARLAGCETLGGLEMLVTQARLQFELWTGRLPASSLMYDAGLAALSH